MASPYQTLLSQYTSILTKNSDNTSIIFNKIESILIIKNCTHCTYQPAAVNNTINYTSVSHINQLVNCLDQHTNILEEGGFIL